MSATKNAIAKVVLVGDGAVGKTSIRRKYMGKGFTSQHLMTLGADFSEKKGEVKHNGELVNYTLQIWDIAGQDNFHAVRQRFLANTSAIMVVFDLNDPVTFTHIGKWIKEVWSVNNDSSTPILLIGNKVDLIEDPEDSKKKAETFSLRLKEQNPSLTWIKYITTSALTGHNIETSFEMIINQILNSKV